MGWVLLGGGLIGSIIGIWFFNLMSRLGQIDLIVQLSYAHLSGHYRRDDVQRKPARAVAARALARPAPKTTHPSLGA